jgi:hypothetical protein
MVIVQTEARILGSGGHGAFVRVVGHLDRTGASRNSDQLDSVVLLRKAVGNGALLAGARCRWRREEGEKKERWSEAGGPWDDILRRYVVCLVR